MAGPGVATVIRVVKVIRVIRITRVIGVVRVVGFNKVMSAIWFIRVITVKQILSGLLGSTQCQDVTHKTSKTDNESKEIAVGVGVGVGVKRVLVAHPTTQLVSSGLLSSSTHRLLFC